MEKKLILNKSIIANLSNAEQNQIIGGASDSISVDCCVNTANLNCLTKQIDIPTIGHDDGSYCISKKLSICRGIIQVPVPAEPNSINQVCIAPCTINQIWG
jgi:hypothetical protein